MADSTTIASDTSVTGRLEGEGDLAVDGYVDGSIDLTETLTIRSGGRVDGDVQAADVVIEGAFQGEIVARRRVVLAPTARAVADIEAPVVEMADGAELRGELTIGGTESAPSPRKTTRSTSRRSATTDTSSRTASGGTSTGSATGRQTTSGTRRETRPNKAATATAVTEPEESADADEETDDADGEFSLDDETLEQYREDFTVKELRDQLRDHDLRVSGTKDELIERLVRHEGA